MKRLLARVSALIATVFVLTPILLQAGPVGEKIVVGNVTLDRSTAGLLTVQQASDRAIINWQDFSIGANEITRFMQPGASSALLNRVVGANPSSILGKLEANGQIFLINPAGILVGPSGVIDTKGFVASTLNLSDESFLNSSKLTLGGDSRAAIQNLGKISASEGNVYLIARTVENAGSISAPGGTVGLAGGTEVILAEDGADKIAVLVGDGGSVSNSGSINAASAELKAAGGNMYALAINNTGLVRANTLVNEGGKIVLKASVGTALSSGTLDASGTVGGEVQVLGELVGLTDNAVVNASGDTGGGTVLIGGDFQGKNESVQNAFRTYAGPNTTIHADAISSGDGGKVIVWANDIARFYGNLTARGGSASGNGGNVEISGKETLSYDGLVNVGAAAGQGGKILFDPRDVTIATGGSTDIAANDIFADNTGVDVTLSPTAIATLIGSTLELQAQSDFIINNNITAVGAGNFTLRAGGSITLAAGVVIDVNGNFSAYLNDAGGTPGDASAFVMTDAASTIRTSSGAGDILIDMAAGNLGGNITLGSLEAIGGDIRVVNNFAAASILSVAGTPIVRADSVSLETTSGAGTIGASGTPIRVRVTNLDAATAGGNIFLNSPTIAQSLNIGSAALGAVTGITSGGTLELTGAGPITQSEVITTVGAATFATGTAYDITLGSANAIGGAVLVTAAKDFTLNNGTATVDFATGSTVISGNLSVTTSHASGITDTGTLSVAGSTSLTATGGNPIALGSVNNFVGPVSFVGGAVALNDSDSIQLAGTASSSTTLTVTSAGSITQNGSTITASGLATFTPAAAGNVILNNTGNNFASVSVPRGAVVTIYDTDAIALDDIGTTTAVSGLLTVQAGDNITQTGGKFVIQTGSAAGANFITTATGKTVILGEASNNFGTGTISATTTTGTLSDVTITSVGAVKIGALTTGGNLSVTAAGAITQNGALSVTGTTALASGNNPVTLSNPANNFGGVVTLTGSTGAGATISISDANSLSMASAAALLFGDITLGAGGNLTIDASGGTGAISGTGIVTVPGTTALTSSAAANISLNNAASDFVGTVTVNVAADLSLTDKNTLTIVVGAADDLTLGNITATDLSITANSGNTITDVSGFLTVPGTTTLSSGGGAGVITLDNTSNDFGTVQVTGGAGAITIVDANAINLGASTVAGSLAVTATAGGDITDSGAISVGTTSTFTAQTGQSVLLDHSGNVFTGVVSFVGSGGSLKDVKITSGAALALGALTVTGDLTAATAGAGFNITQGGALIVPGTATFTTAGNGAITLGAANNFGKLAINAPGNGAVAVTDSNAVILSASTVGGTYSITATAGNITNDGTLAITGAATFTAAGGASITLDSASNNFTGAVAFASGGTLANVTITDNSDLELGAVTVATALTVKTTGPITQTGATVLTAPTASFETSGNVTITLGEANDFGTLLVNSPGNAAVALTDANSVILGNTTVGGTYAITATAGDITDSGTLTITGASTFTAVGTTGSVTLDSALNNFTGDVSFAGVGTDLLNVSITDNSALNLTALTLVATGNLTVNSQGAADLTDQGALVIPGTTTITVASGRNVILDHAGNDFGVIVVNQAQNITLADINGIDLGTMAPTGTLSVTGSGNVLTPGAIVQSGTLTVTGGTATFANGVSGDITLAGANNFGTLVITSGQNVTVSDQNAIILGASTIAGNLSLTASAGTAGTITQSGALAVNGTTTLVNTGQDITLDNVSNNFLGAVTITSAKDVALKDANAIVLGAMTVTGNLGVTALSGTITQSGALAVTGTATMSATGNNITLNNAANNFATLAISAGNDILIVDANALVLGTSTVLGNLGVTTSGAITESGVVSVNAAGKVATFNAGGNAITLNTENNLFKTVVFTGATDTVTVKDADSIDLGTSSAAALTVTSLNGDITQSGPLTVTGNANFITTAGTGNITINNAGNAFGNVGFTTGSGGSSKNVSVRELGAFGFLASTVEGTLTVKAGGTVTQTSGTLVIGGVASFDLGASTALTLADPLNDFATVTITSAGAVTLADQNAIILGSGSLISGNLSVDANPDNVGTETITQSGAITVLGTTTLKNAAGANITLSSANDFVGAVSVVRGLDVSLTDANSINLGASTVSGNFSVTAAGTITDSGTLVVNGTAKTATFAAGAANNITLDDAANDFTKVAITTGNNVSLIDANALNIGAGTVSGNLSITTQTGAGLLDFAGALTVGGNLTLTPSGAVSEGAGTVAVTGTTTITAAGLNVVLGGANNFVGPVSVTGVDVTLTDSNAIDLGASTVTGNLSLTAGGAVTDSGTLAVTGTSTISASGQTVTLDSPANNFVGAVGVTGAAVTLVDVGAINLGASTVSGTYTVTAGDNITSSGALAITGAATFTAPGTKSISVDTAGTVFTGAVAFNAVSGTLQNVSILDGSALAVPALTLAGNLTVATTAAGFDITQSGALVVPGTATFTTVGATTITLNNAANNFGTVAVTSPGGSAVAFTDVDAVILGATSIGGALTVVSGGDITESGVVSVTGATTLTSGTGGSINLGTQANHFAGAITVSAATGNVLNLGLRADDNIAISGPLTLGGTLTVITTDGTGKNITQTGGALIVTGTTTLTAGTGSVTLATAGNDFTGAVAVVSANNVTLLDAGAIDLGAMTVAGNLTLTAGGAVSNSGTLAITGTTGVTATGFNVSLNSGANNFVGAVSVAGADVILVDAGAIDLGASTITGTLSVTAGGAITDSGNLVVNGTAKTTTLVAGANNIVLNSAGNDFTTVVITSGQDVTLVDANALDLGASTVSGNLTVTPGAALSDSGVVAVTGTTTISASGLDVVLDQANNFGGAVTVAGANVTLTDANAIDLGASTVSGTLTLNASGAVTDSGTLAITGATTVNAAGQAVTLNSAANNFVGAVSVNGLNVALVDVGAIDLGASTVTGTYAVTAGDDITSSGTLTITGASTFIAPRTKSITVNDAANVFTGTVSFAAVFDSLQNVTIVDTTALDLPALSILGNLTVTAGGALTDSGTLVIPGTTSITATGQNVTLDSVANNFGGAVTVAGANVTLVDVNAIDLGASTITGNLILTAGGAVSDSGTLLITGTTAITATTFNVVLDQVANDFTGAVSANGLGVTLVDVNAINLGASTITGALTVTAGGAVSNTGTLAVTGATSVTATGFNVSLNSALNNFVGAVSVVGADVTIIDANAVDLGASTVTGNLSVTAAGLISDSGNVVVNTAAKTATFVAGAGNNIVLDRVANDFTKVIITSGNNVTILDANAVELGASTVTGNLTLTAGGAVDLAAGASAVGGNLSLTATGAVTDTGTIAVTGTTLVSAATLAVTLDSANNFVGAVSVLGSNVALVDSGAIVLGASTVTGTYAVTAGDSITSTGALDITGAATFTAPTTKSISLNDAANTFLSTVTFASGGTLANVTIVDDTALDLSALTISGNLAVTTGGALSDSGTLVVPGTTTITATGQNVVLDQAANNFGGAVSVAGANVTLVDVNAIDLAASTVTGTLTLTAGGAVSDSGTIAVTGVTTVNAAGQNVILDQAANNFVAAVLVSGANVTLVDANAIILGASTVTGNLAVTAGGAVSNTGTLAVTGTTTVTATGNAVALNSAANNFGGAVSVAGLGVTLVDVNAIDLGASTITGALTVTAGGAVSDSGILAVTGVTTVNASGQNVVLDSANNFVGAVSVTGANVTLVDANAIDLGASTISGNLTVTASGAITDSGAVVANGAATIATFAAGAGNNIVLDDAANNFTTVVITTGLDVTLVDVNAINFGASAVSGNLVVTAGGAVTQTGVITANGVAKSATITATGFDVTLSLANDFTTVGASGANVTLTDANAVALGASTVSGNLIVTAAGAVSNSGTLVITGTTSVSNAGNNVVLNSAANNFTGAVSVTGVDVTLVDVNAINLGIITATGDLTVTAGGAITDSGTLLVTTALKTASFTNTAGDITLDDLLSDFTILTVSSAGNVSVTDDNSVVLGTSSAGGTLTITADNAGSITQATSATLQPTGAATFNVGATANVVLGNSGNVFGGTVSFAPVVHGTITVRDSNDISLGLLSAGTLTVTADQGAITQGAAWTATTATLTVPGVHTGNVSVNLASANDFGTLTINQTSVAGGSVTVVEANSIILGASTVKKALSITAGNDITQTGALTTSSTSSFTATSGSITLSNAANNFATGVTIGGTLVNLSITDTTPIAIADGTSASGAITVKAPLISIGDDAGGADTITGTGSQTYDGPVVLNEVSGTTFVSSGTVWFKDTVDSATANNTTLLGEQGITVNTTGLTQFDKAVGSQRSLTSLTTDAGGTVSLGVTTVAQTITAATISFGEDVTIVGNPTFYGSTSVAFGGKVEGSASVETVAINSPTTSFAGTVGATTPLASLTTDSDGTTTLNTATLKALVVDLKDTVALTAATTIGGATTTSVTLGGVTLSQNLTLQASGAAGAVTVNGNIKDTDHTHTLAITAVGTATLSGNLGSAVANDQPNTVTVTGASIVLKGTEITTAGDQTYTGPVTIGATTTLTGANIQFTSTVDADSAASARALTLATSATTKLDGAIGGTTKFGTLTISGAGVTTLGTGAALGITATSQSYGQTIALASDTTFTGSNIAFSGAAVDGAKVVVITAGDVTTINSVFGGVTPITTLATDSAGSTILQQNVTTSSTQVYADTVQVAADVTLNGSAITFSKTLDSDATGTRNLTLNATADVTMTGVVGGTASFANLTTDVGGNTLINGGAVTAVTQVYGDTVKILKATTLTGTTVTLAAVDKGGSTDQNLTVTASGVTTFGGVVAGVKDLVVDGGGSTAINAATVTTSGNQTITDTLTIGVDSTLTGKDISLAQVDGVGAGTEDLTLVATGTIYESANVGSGNKFDVLTFNGKLVISANETMDANTIVFLKEVDADTADLRTLLVNATTTTFTKAVGGSKRLLSLTTDAAGTTTVTGNVTAKTQNYQDDVTIAGNITLTAPTVSAVVGTVTFGKTLEPSAGTVALTIKAAGDTTFDGTVGAGTSFLSLTTDGTKSGAVYTDKVQINGGSIGATTLKIGENVVISTGTTLSGTTISVAGALDGTGASTEALTINATGVTTLSGAVGAGTALLSLTTDGVGASESTVLLGNVTATTQTYGDDVTIGGDLTLTGTEVTFNKIVKGAAANKQDLTINTAGGAIVFTGKVGSTAFDVLSTLGSGTVSISGGTVSAVTQSFDSIVKILADTTFSGTTVEFKNTLDETGSGGLYAVTVNATTTKFNSEVGTTAKLLNLKTDSKGTTTIFADIQATTIDFTDDVILDIPGAGTAGTLTLQATDVSFAKTISSQASGENPNLLVNASGTTTFKGNVGANSLKPLNITTDAAGTTVLQGTVIITGKNLTLNDPVVLQGAATLYPEVALAMKNTANGAQTLTVGAGSGGSIEIEAAIGGTTTLTKFVSQGNVTAHPEYGTIHLRNGGITATTQEYNNSVSLEANATLTGSTVTIVGTVLGDGVANQRQLNIVASGVTTLKNIGNNGAGDLGLVQTDSKGSTVLTGVIYGTTLQFQDPAVIDGTAVALNATTVAFDKTIEGKDKASARTLGTGTFDYLSNQGVKTIAIGQKVGTVTGNFGSGTAGKIYKSKVAGSLTLTTETYADTARWELVGDQSTALWNFLSDFETQTVSAGDKVGLTSAYGSGGVATTVYSYVPAGPTAVALNTQDYADPAVWKQVFTTGDNRLTVNASGTATFSGSIGKTKSLSELTFGGAGTTIIASDVSSFYLTAGRPITLLANSTVTAPVRADFSSTIDGDVADTRSLTVNGGRVIFTGAVGATRALSTIRTDATGTPYDTTTFTTGVIAADTITLKDTLKQAVNTTVTGKTVTFATIDAGANTLALNGTAITVEGVTSGALTVNGPINLKGNVTTAGANQTYNDTVNVDGNLTLNGATLAFAKSVDAKAASSQLTLTASAANTIGAGLGASREFNTLTITAGPVALTGDVKSKTLLITPAVTLQSDSVVTASTSATFTAALVGNAKSLTVNGGNVVFTANPSGLVNLKTDAAGTAKGFTEFATGTTVTGDLIIKDKLVLLANTTLSGANVTVGEVVSGKTGALGSYSLTVNVADATGLATFNGNIGVVSGPLNEAILTTLTVADAGAQTGSFELGKGTISVNTSGAQTYSIGGDLVGNVTLTGTTVGFSKAVNAKTANAGTFLVNNTGVLTIAEGLGATRALSSFTTGTGGSTTLTGDLGAKTVDIKNALTLGGHVVVTASTSAKFVGITGTSDSLTVNGGDVEFAAVPTGLLNLSTDSGTGVAVKGSTKFTSATPSLSTTGAITINDKLILTDTTTLTGATGVTLGEVVSLTTSKALTVNAGNGQTISLTGNIGKVKTGASEVNLLSLTVASADTLGSIVLGKASNGTITIDTTGAQSYADVTTLKGTATLTAVDGTTPANGDVTFSKAIQAPAGLTANAGKLVVKTSDVGTIKSIGAANGAASATIGLAEFTTGTTGTSSLGGDIVATTITYGNVVTLTASSVMTARTSATFAGVTGGGNSLTVNGGSTTFNANPTGLLNLKTDDTGTVGGTTTFKDGTAVAVTVTGDLVINDTMALSADSAFTAANIGLDKVNGAFALTLTASAKTTLADNIGSSGKLTTLTVNTVNLDLGVNAVTSTMTITTTGAQTWNETGTSVLLQNVKLTADTTPSITIDTVNGHTLTLAP